MADSGRRVLFAEENDALELASLASTSQGRGSDEVSQASRRTSSSSRSSLGSEELVDYGAQAMPMVPLSRTIDGQASEVAPKTVTFRNGLGLVIGLQIGSGIFSTPGLVAQVGSPGASILVWVVSGLLAWTGAASYAELGASLPFNGGSHAYLRHIYGDMAAFLFSFTAILALKPGSAAIISIICSEYINDIVFRALFNDLVAPGWLIKLIAIFCAACAGGIVALSTRGATRAIDVFTISKIITLITVTAAGFAWLGVGKGTDTYKKSLFAGSSLSIGTYIKAGLSGLWSYDGWDNCSYVSAEMVDPGRDIPRVVHTAQPIVIAAYVLANLAYFAVLSLQDIQQTHTIALDFGSKILGHTGALVLGIAVILSSFGALLSSTFTSARLVAASGEHHELPERFGKLHPKTNTPVAALGLQFGITVLYILIGDFEHLVLFYGICAWLFFLATVLGLIILRAREPKLERPYRAWLSTPIVFCCAALFIIIRMVFEATTESAIGLGFIVLGIPLYFLRFGLRQSSAQASGRASVNEQDNWFKQQVKGIREMFARLRGNGYRAV